MRVLLVDDHPDTVDALAMLLSAAGHELRVAYDGPTCLELALTFSPQVAIVDIEMPGMDGRTVAQKLRGQFRVGDLHIVSLTGRNDRTQVMMSECFDQHLHKPVSATALLQALTEAESVLRERRGARISP